MFKNFKNNIIKIKDLVNYFLIFIVNERVDTLKYVCNKSGVTHDYIEKVIKVLKTKNK
jgi:hypothetical protein